MAGERAGPWTRSRLNGAAMSDRLALANAIEDAGIERSKAERVASVIFDAIHDNVATKADVQASEASLRAEMAAAKAELKTDIASARNEAASNAARHDVAIERLRSTLRQTESRLLLRLGSLMVVLTGAVLAALRYLPPH